MLFTILSQESGSGSRTSSAKSVGARAGKNLALRLPRERPGLKQRRALKCYINTLERPSRPLCPNRLGNRQCPISPSPEQTLLIDLNSIFYHSSPTSKSRRIDKFALIARRTVRGNNDFYPSLFTSPLFQLGSVNWLRKQDYGVIWGSGKANTTPIKSDNPQRIPYP